MREPARDNGRLQDILQAADYISTFIDNLTLDDFKSDKLRYFAVLKNVEIIGEAAYMLSISFKEDHPDIPWADIIRMRHVLVHGYATVLPDHLWKTAIMDVPELSRAIKAILK